ncbi:beige/BEACH domain protein, putative [Plasmodium malariae]|uniref:Beige/BEACH domain protein, putative n=1 Tax=Plasmodium malariae TaxID=5858 RepID=A0A1D3PBX2_PLAMA|nr:beige/BEACH domain protein, putative [Plasmodium malariae]SCN12760.1 beige/BEACH domain protein, putative [Plasmodium malariae]
MEKSKIRNFNLLFLEEDEEYIDDMLITMRKKQSEEYADMRGRLRLCSKSLVFEPYDTDEEVLKFPFKKLENAKMNTYNNQIIVKTSEVIKIKTITFNKKTRCTCQFTYDRKNRRSLNLMNSYYNEYYDEFKSIDNNNIDEKIGMFEKVLNNFDENENENESDSFAVVGHQERKSSAMWSNGMGGKSGGTHKKVNSSGECGTTAVSAAVTVSTTAATGGGASAAFPPSRSKSGFVYIFEGEGSSSSGKKLKLIYGILVKIKIAMIIHEKQMEILIKEKKSRQGSYQGSYHASRESNGQESSGQRGVLDIGQNNKRSGGKKDGPLVGQNDRKRSGQKDGQFIGQSTGVSSLEDDNVNTRKELNLEKYIENVLEKLTENIRFDISSISIHEKIITNRMDGYWVFKVSPLLKMKGILNITNKFIYFQPNPNFTNKKEKKWKTESILHVFKRIIIMKPNALEIIFDDEKKKYNSLYVEFVNFDDREMIIKVLKKIKPECLLIEENKNFIYAVQNKWVNGLITNYEYLDFLNCIAGRSRKDFSQYPVFPWVLTNYSSKEINLNDENVYRILSKSVGCLNINRLNSLIEKMQDHDYFYGSHYSTLAYVVYFLIRLYPECQLKLQSGKFDTHSRMFLSVESTFNTALNANSSFIELIPEFYEDDDNFLKNNLNINTNEGNIHDVTLPLWSNTPKDFLIKMKNALESKYVNDNLNEWINLIFGYKQSGQLAKDNFNLFHPLTYMHAILNEKLSMSYKSTYDNVPRTDEESEFEKNFNQKIKALITTMPSKALKTQLHEFGQCPFQIFKDHHVSRKKNVHVQYNENIKNAPWYYSSVIQNLLKKMCLRKKRRDRKKYSANINSPNALSNNNFDEEEEDEEYYESFEDDYEEGYASRDRSDRGDDRDGRRDINVNVNVNVNVNDNDNDNDNDGGNEDDTGEGGKRKRVVIRGKYAKKNSSCSGSATDVHMADSCSVKYTSNGEDGRDHIRIERGEGRGYLSSFKRHIWDLKKIDHIPCVIKGVGYTDNSVCFVCNNGFIKLISYSDLLNYEIRNNNNLISLKLGEENFSCVTNIQDNYIVGTWNGNILFLNPSSILKANRVTKGMGGKDVRSRNNHKIAHERRRMTRTTRMTRRKEEKEQDNQKDNENENEKEQIEVIEGNSETEQEEREKSQNDDASSIPSNCSDISLNDSNDSLLSSFDDVFEYEFHEKMKKNKNAKCKKDEFMYTSNIYNQMIMKKIHNDSVNCMCYSNNYLATGSSDETLQLIDIEQNFEIMQTYDDFNDSVKYVQLRNQLLFTWSDSFKLFDIRIPKKKINLVNPKSASNGSGNGRSTGSNNNNDRNNISNVRRNDRCNDRRNDRSIDQSNNQSNDQSDSEGNIRKTLSSKLSPSKFFQFYNNEQLRMFYNTIQKVYEQNYIPINYSNPQYLYEKKIKKNANSTYTKNFPHIIYSALINDTTILCIDENNNFYFYDIRNENWINIISNSYNSMEKKKSKIVIACCNKQQQVCTINDLGEISFEYVNIYDNYNNINRTPKESFFSSNCSINPSYISFLNHYDSSYVGGTNASEESTCNYILLTGVNGMLEIHKKVS